MSAFVDRPPLLVKIALPLNVPVLVGRKLMVMVPD